MENDAETTEPVRAKDVLDIRSITGYDTDAEFYVAVGDLLTYLDATLALFGHSIRSGYGYEVSLERLYSQPSFANDGKPAINISVGSKEDMLAVNGALSEYVVKAHVGWNDQPALVGVAEGMVWAITRWDLVCTYVETGEVEEYVEDVVEVVGVVTKTRPKTKKVCPPLMA